MMMRMIMAIRACKLIAPYISFAGIIWILLVDKLDNPPRRRSLLHVSHLPAPLHQTRTFTTGGEAGEEELLTPWNT